MMSSELHVAALEEQNRLLRKIVKVCLAVFVLLAALAIGGWSRGGDDIVRARIFIAVNDAGKEVAFFGATSEGTGVIKASDAKGKDRVVIGVGEEDQGSVQVYDENDVDRLRLGFWGHSKAVLLLADSANHTVLTLGELLDSRGLELMGTKAPQLTLGVSKNCPFVGLHSEDGATMASWAYNPAVFSGMTFYKPAKAGDASAPILYIDGDLGRLEHIKSASFGDLVEWPPKK
jgi:hypothetical protein